MPQFRFLKSIESFLTFFGCAPRLAIIRLLRLPRYFSELREFTRQQAEVSGVRGVCKLLPYLDDYKAKAGVMRGHYFHQDLLVARRIFENSPLTHVDIGSRVDGFVAHVASFRDIKLVDIRPLQSSCERITFVQADIMKVLPESLVASTDSISCLHALEHFGLGRYSDTIDVHGHAKGWANITKMLARGGKAYLSVPFGPSRVEFNAHRVFSLHELLEMVGNNFTLDRFSYVCDSGNLHDNVVLTKQMIDSNCDCHFGCAILEMTKSTP